jgi:hypothetical protein
MTPLPDFSAFCEAACIALWGEPDSRDRKQLRWNGHDAYSARSYSVRKKAWYDHGEDHGGSTLDLVDYAKGQPKRKLTGAAFFEAWREARVMGLPVPDPPERQNGGGGPIIATYPYVDETSAFLFEVVRFDTPNPDDRFRQRRPDGAGGWIWNVKGVRTRILYRLPALIEAVKASQRILVCEGERDANTAVALGFTATTNPGGVNKWFAEYDQFFRGADVVIVSDNDPQARDKKTGALQFHPDGRPVHVGQDHAAKVARRLRKVAAHVGAIMFDEKDLTAWREAGGTRAQLEARIEAAPDLVRQPEPDDGPDDEEPAEDSRPRSQVPSKDGEILPVMRLHDQRLTVDEPEPPMRNLSGWPVEVRTREPAGMHALTAAGANDEEEKSDRLPPPALNMLVTHDSYSMAVTIERYAAFYKKQRLPTRLPDVFVAHYLRYEASLLPRVASLATMPLVLPNGRLLATNGLDGARRIVFRIEPEIVGLMPHGRISGAALAEAINLLTEEWLVDVKTDYDGKCVLIAMALSIIERDLFGERPAFFVTAGKRGGGKTTALNMIALAVLGKRAPAMAWSASEEERRKGLFAALRQGLAFMVFDNIAAGSTLSCPHLEKMLTSAEMRDRVLSESRDETVGCSAIPAFTGNNIQPKGELASRSLEARITVDRPDPENRRFVHQDPIGWTLDHRRAIIAALYTILAGNPLLKEKPGGEKTRFKPWWRLVGSAIEHAAEKAVRGVDFGKLFLKVEEKDEEALGLADALQRFERLRVMGGGGKAITAARVLTWANQDTDDGHVLHAFLGAAARPLTTNGISRTLKAKTDAPTRVRVPSAGGGAEEEIWMLVAKPRAADGLTEFEITKRAGAAISGRR